MRNKVLCHLNFGPFAITVFRLLDSGLCTEVPHNDLEGYGRSIGVRHQAKRKALGHRNPRLGSSAQAVRL